MKTKIKDLIYFPPCFSKVVLNYPMMKPITTSDYDVRSDLDLQFADMDDSILLEELKSNSNVFSTYFKTEFKDFSCQPLYILCDVNLAFEKFKQPWHAREIGTLEEIKVFQYQIVDNLPRISNSSETFSNGKVTYEPVINMMTQYREKRGKKNSNGFLFNELATELLQNAYGSFNGYESLEESIVDGPNDGGLDSIWFEFNNVRISYNQLKELIPIIRQMFPNTECFINVHFVQSKFLSVIPKNSISLFLLDIANFMNSTEGLYFNHKVSCFKDLISQIYESEIKIKIFPHFCLAASILDTDETEILKARKLFYNLPTLLDYKNVEISNFDSFVFHGEQFFEGAY